MPDSVESPKNARRKFTPLHFSLQKLGNADNKYVMLGLNGDSQLSAKILSHKQAVAQANRDHPDVRVPIDGNPNDDIIYVWNEALNQYVPQASA